MADEQKDIWQLTSALRFYPRSDGFQWLRVLQQAWNCIDGPNIGAVDWRDVPFVEDEERV